MHAVRKPFALLLAAGLLAIGAPVAAQQADAPAADAPAERPALPAPESVLEHIPANAMGFIVLPDVREGLQGTDAYLQRIGLGPMVQQQMPDGLLAGLRQAARLGEGFNPTGGAAIVLLNLDDFGLGGDAIFRKAEAGEEIEPPVLLLIPGASVEGVLGAYGVTGDGPRKHVNIGSKGGHAMQVGGYVALTPVAKALDHVEPAKLKAAGTMAGLPKAHRAMIADAAVAMHMDMARVRPLLVGMMQMTRKRMAAQRRAWEAQRERMIEQGYDMPAAPPPFAPMENALKVYEGLYGWVLKQMGPVTVTARYAPGHLRVEERLSLKTGSTLAKAALAFRPGGPVALDRLPSLPYVFALGAAMPAEEAVPATMAAVRPMQEAINEALGGVPEDVQARQEKLTERMYRNLRSMQLVVGGAPAGSGVFGLGVVYRCNDAKQLQADIRTSFQLTNQYLAGMEALKEQDFRLVLQEGLETVAGHTVDAVDVQMAALTKLDADERKEMARAVGEDKIRLRVAGVDANTVVLTFGGSTGFLGEMAKAADGKAAEGQAIVAEATGVQDLRKLLPKGRMFEGMISPTNLVQAMLVGARKMGVPAEELPPIPVTPQPPIAIGGALEDADVHYLAVVPDATVAELVQLAMMWWMQASTGGMDSHGEAPPPGGF